MNAPPAPRAGRPFAIALCNEVLRDRPFEAQCELAAALGYDALEVAPLTLADDPATLATAHVAALRRSAEAAGIRISGLHWLLTAPPGLSITSADPWVRARTLAHMRAMIDLCAALGGDVLVHGSPDQRRLSDDDPEGDAERGRAAFAEVAEHAHRAGVHYLIEPLSPQETRFVTCWAEAAAIVHASSWPSVAPASCQRVPSATSGRAEGADSAARCTRSAAARSDAARSNDPPDRIHAENGSTPSEP